MSKEKIKISIQSNDEGSWTEEDVIYVLADWDKLIKYLDKMPFHYRRDDDEE